MQIHFDIKNIGIAAALWGNLILPFLTKENRGYIIKGKHRRILK